MNDPKQDANEATLNLVLSLLFLIGFFLSIIGYLLVMIFKRKRRFLVEGAASLATLPFLISIVSIALIITKMVDSLLMVVKKSVPANEQFAIRTVDTILLFALVPLTLLFAFFTMMKILTLTFSVKRSSVWLVGGFGLTTCVLGMVGVLVSVAVFVLNMVALNVTHSIVVSVGSYLMITYYSLTVLGLFICGFLVLAYKTKGQVFKDLDDQDSVNRLSLLLGVSICAGSLSFILHSVRIGLNMQTMKLPCYYVDACSFFLLNAFSLYILGYGNVEIAKEEEENASIPFSHSRAVLYDE